MGATTETEIQGHLETMLEPLVGFALAHGLTVQHLTESLKRTLVKVAAREVPTHGRRANVSRISVVTGIHRREVDRLLHGDAADAPLTASISARVVGQWEQDREFLTAKGKPRALSYGCDSSDFRKLVAKVSKDVNPAAVLFDLERSGIVQRRKNRITLNRSSYLIREDAETVLKLLSRDCADLMSAVLENISSNDELPHLHARTEYDNVDQGALAKIRKALLDRGSTFHEELRTLLSKHDLDISPHAGKSGGGRVAVITVSYSQGSEKAKRKGRETS